jgi:hypothetical protein
MMNLNRAFVRQSIITALCVLSAVEIGCTDVGDNSAGGGVDGSGDDVSVDASLGPDSSAGQDGSTGPDGTVGDDGTPAQEAETDAMAPQVDATLDGEPVGVPDAQPESGAPESGAPESGAPESGAPESGAPESGAPESGAPEAGVEAGSPDAGEHDASVVDAAVDSGGEGGSTQPLVPCTTAGQTNCVECDQNVNKLCTATEAIIVTRDIEEGFVHSDGTLTAGSCYECSITNGILDSDVQGFSGDECGDLAGAAVQQCLNALNCYLGSPQSGTAGLSGTNSGATPAQLAADCGNEKPAGVFNCFCGTNEPDVTDCKNGGTVAAGATGGHGVASPNGACINQIIAGTGTTTSTLNATIITDMGNTTLGAGLAAQFLQNAGSNLDTPSCAQCFQ